MNRHRYRAYGMTLESDVALPELDETDPAIPPDLHIALEPVQGPMPAGRAERLCRIDEDGAYFAWEGMARLRISNGNHIAVCPEAGIDDRTLAFALLGPVIAAFLHGRGDLILHGSAVEIRANEALLFVGDNGAGKSSLAASCVKAGHSLVNDDVAAIIPGSNGETLIRRGFPAMKLSRSALAAFAPMPGSLLPSPTPEAAKLRLRLPKMAAGPLRLSHVYLVKRAAKFDVRPLDAADRLHLAMRYSYMPKLGPDALAPSAAASHFRACAALAHGTAASVLHVPDGLDALPDVVKKLAGLA